MKKRIRLQGMLMFLSIITILFLSKFIFPYWKHKLPDDFTDALGVILVLSGFFIRIVARGYKADGSINGGKLLREGIYGIIRNPMYAGTFLIGLGIVLVLFVWWAFLIFAAVFISIYYRQVRKEEKVLSSHFGPEYGGYCKTTPRYFPRISRIFSSDPRYRIFFRLRWIRKELPSLIFVIAAVIIIEIWQDIQLFGKGELLGEFLDLFLITLLFAAIVLLFLTKRENSQ